MDQPLGQMCGNAVEVHEVLEVLKGGGPADVRELTLQLAAELLLLTRRAVSLPEAVAAAAVPLDSGRALERFERMVAAQGGRLSQLPKPAPAIELLAGQSGFLGSIDTEQLGLGLIELGAGRRQLNDQLDPTTGLQMLVRVGDPIEAGQPLLRVFYGNAEVPIFRLAAAIRISSSPLPPAETLIAERIFS